MGDGGPGTVVVLNGAPRAGKTSIARAIQERGDGVWLALGVDAWAGVIPARLWPGIGLRPGGERPDLEQHVPTLVAGLYAAVAAQSRLGLHVVVDVGHHDAYSRPLGTLAIAARALAGLPAWLVGVRCPLAEVVARRDAAGAEVAAAGERREVIAGPAMEDTGEPGAAGAADATGGTDRAADAAGRASRATYATSGPDGSVPEPVRRWQETVHDPGIYDLEVDTSALTPEQAADTVLAVVTSNRTPAAFARVAIH